MLLKVFRIFFNIANSDARKIADRKNICYILDIFSYQYSINEVYLDGNDPSLHPNINDIVDYCSSKGFTTNIFTNNPDIFLNNNYLMKKFIDNEINSIRFKILNSKDLENVIKLKKMILNYNQNNDYCLDNRNLKLISDRIITTILINNLVHYEFEKIFLNSLKDDLLTHFSLLIEDKKTRNRNNLEKTLNYLIMKYSNKEQILEKKYPPTYYLFLRSNNENYINISYNFKKYFNEINIPSEIYNNNIDPFSINIDLMKKSIKSEISKVIKFISR